MSAASIIRQMAGEAPVEIGLVLGSGLGPLADQAGDAVSIPYAALPGFPRSGVSGHQGRLVIGRLGGRRVAILSGRAHYYETGDAAAMRPALETLKALGAGALILTNAAGSLRPEIGPTAIVAHADYVNWSGRNPLIGEEGDARFVDMRDAYDPDLRARLQSVAARLEIPLHEGVYFWFSGPSFETPAEIRAMKILGADLVGMSTVPEVILARRLGLRVAALSMVTNLAAGFADAEISHKDTKAVAAAGGATLARLIIGLLEDGI
ncbi:MAG: purine-nucleoside phosphorylase [Hyphomicrobiales bacterium]|nr:purine-nucleoside phosphorylase [Hyphomicrobiales bacterium]